MQTITFKYKNYRGEVSTRTIVPDSLEFYTVPDPKYGYQPGWFLSGHDQAKNARRSFALTHIILEDNIAFDGGVIGKAFCLRLRD